MTTRAFSLKKIQDYEEAQSVFRTWDEDGDGRLVAAEIKAAEKMAVRLSPDFLDRFDGDKSGAIELHEFLVAIDAARKLAGTKKRPLSPLFQEVDIRRLETAYRMAEEAGLFPQPDLFVHTLNAIEALRKGQVPESLMVPFLSVVASEGGSNTDEILGALPGALIALSGTTLSAKEEIRFLTQILAATKSSAAACLKALPALLGIEGRTEEVLKFVKEVVRNTTGKRGSLAYGVFDGLHGAIEALGHEKVSGADTLSFLRDMIARTKTGAGDALRLLVVCAPHLSESDLPTFQERFYSLWKTLSRNVYSVSILAELSGKDPFDVEDASGLAQWASSIVNGGPAQQSGGDFWSFYQAASVLLNGLPLKNSQGKHVRKKAVEQLSRRSLYLLSSVGAPDLYRSTFALIYDRISADAGFLKGLSQDDPQGEFLPDFLMTLALHGKLTEVYRRDPSYLLEGVLTLLNVEWNDELLHHVMLLQGLVGEILQTEDLAKMRPAVERFLIGAYLKAEKARDVERRAAYGFLVRRYASSFEDKRALRIAKGLPPIPSPEIPSTWLQDGTLRARFYFFDDERAHFQLVQKTYRDMGFTIHEGEDDRTVLMTKVANDVTLEVTVTLDRGEIDALMTDASIDILAHRGHSYHLAETFSSTDQGQARQKLLYLGSCGSFRDVPEMIPIYRGNYMISDQDTAYGADNNHILYYLMEAIAGGEKKWEAIRDYVQAHYDLEGKGIIFPGDPEMLLFEFVEALKTKK